MDIQKWQETKRRVEELKRAKERASGAIELLLKQVKTDFGCKNLQEAEEYLDQLDNEIEQLETKLKKSFSKFEEKYGDRVR